MDFNIDNFKNIIIAFGIVVLLFIIINQRCSQVEGYETVVTSAPQQKFIVKQLASEEPIQTTHTVVAPTSPTVVTPQIVAPVTTPAVQLVNFDKNLRLDEDGNTWVLNNLGVDGNTKIKGTFETDGQSRFRDYVGVDGNLEVAGPASFNSLAEFNGGMNVSKLGTFRNDLKVIGHLMGKNNMTISHNAKIGGSLDVDNVARFRNVMDVKGDVYANKDFKVFGNTRLEKDMHVGGPSVIHNKLTVDGVGTFKNNMGIVGDTKIKGGLSVGANSFFDKDMQIKGQLKVHGGVGSGYPKKKDVFMMDNNWGEIVEGKCPHNHFVCGMKARYEQHNNRNKDRAWDTGVNGLWLQCCPFN